MANYNNLKTAIQDVIKANGNQEITGEIMQNALLSMINSLGAGYQFVSVATPETNPGTPDQKVFYIANGKGTYVNFGGLVVDEDEVVLLVYDDAWKKLLSGIASNSKLTELDVRVFGLDAKLGFRFDSDKIIKGSYYHSSTGVVLSSPTYDRTPLIEVEGDYLFYGGLNRSISIASFDKNKTFISYAGTDPARDSGVFALPDGTRYVGINFKLELYPDGYSNGYIYVQSELREYVELLNKYILDMGETVKHFRVKNGDNLLNPLTILPNTVLSANGKTVASTIYYTTDYIKIQPNTQYKILFRGTGSATARGYELYDGKKHPVLFNFDAPTASIQTTTNAQYIRLSIGNSYGAANVALSLADVIQFEEYFQSLQYLGDSHFDDDIVNRGQVNNLIGQIPLINSLPVVSSTTDNLLNPDEIENGKFLSNFNVVALESYNTTGYIPVQPNTTYKMLTATGTFGARQWDEYGMNKNGILEHNDPTFPTTFTTGANTYFVRISYSASYTDGTQLGLFESNVQSFVPYGTVLDFRVNGMPLSYDSKTNKSLVTKQELENAIEEAKTGITQIEFTKTGKDITIKSGDFQIQAALDLYPNSYYGYNHQFNFRRYVFGNNVQSIDINDDVAPAHIINTTIGANHGQPCSIGTITGHGLTNTAIGTGWTHTNGTVYYITRIVDSNRIQFLSENKGTTKSPNFIGLITGTLSRNGATLNVTAVAGYQLYPSSQNIVQHIYLDGTNEITADGTYNCNFVDVVETYDVADPVSVLQNLIARAGSSAEPTMNGDALLKIKNIYRFLPGNNVIIFATYIPQREMAFQNFMFNQSGLATTFSYYLPNSNPIKGYDFRTPRTVNWSSSVPALNVVTANMADPTKPVNRVVTYGNNFGFAIGYLPIAGVGKSLNDSTLVTFEIRNDTGKIYPHGVDYNKIGSTLQANQIYSAVMYRALINNGNRTGNRMSMYNFDVNGDEFVYLDYSGSMVDNVKIDPKLNGREIEIVESVNTTLVSDVYNDGFYVKADYTNGKTCFMVVKIKK